MSENNSSHVVTACTRLEPIDKEKLAELARAGKANPQVIKTLKCKTVAQGRFRHANYIRDLAPYSVDEPPGLLGDDTAPNPSEAVLAALGSCIAVGVHANAVARDIVIQTLEIELEGDLNITAVWGAGDLDENKPLGFTDIRIKVILQSSASAQEQQALIAHACKYSPVLNTMTRNVRVVAH